MEGVIMLDTGNVCSIFGASVSAIAIMAFASFIVFVANDLFVPAIISIIIFVASIVTATVSPSSRITTYKVTISDSVDFNEFTEKYEIINMEGKIYEVILREEK